MKNNSPKPEKSEELEEYIHASLTAIRKGVEAETGFSIHGLVEFDLAVTKVREGKGGLRIYVAEASGKQKSESVSRLRFKVKPKSPK